MSVIVKLIPQSDTSNTHLKNLQNYIAKPEANQESGLDVWYFNAMDNKSAHAEMLALNEVNSRAKNTYKHLLISFSPDVFPTREQAYEASQLMLREMGLDECVAMVGMHYDQDHVHLHVAVITINPDTFKSVHAEWAINAMHRAAAKINYLQGWKPQNNQRYSMININDQIIALKNPSKRRISKANEISAYQGQRTAAEVAAEVVETALNDVEINSWDAFNKRLSDSGIEYQKKGSGSIFMIEQGDKQVAVKASVVNRKATMKLLEIKFGPFISNTHSIQQKNIEPVKGMSDPIKQSWQNFNKLKETAAAEKLKFKEFQHVGYKKLLDAQKDVRKNQLMQGWKGRGALLNQARKSLAGMQAEQRKEFKQDQLIQKTQFIHELCENNGPTLRFDNYLKLTDPDLLMLHKRQQIKKRKENIVFPNAIGVETNNAFSKANKIEGYETRLLMVNNQSINQFCYEYINEDGRVDFVDDGERIKLLHYDHNNHQSISAFLKLSSQKWSKFKLTGSIEFKYLCAQQAINLKIDQQITNVEVQQMIKTIIQNDNAKRDGIPAIKINLPNWNRPIYPIKKHFKSLSVQKITKPINQNDLAVDAYLIFAEDLAEKPTNDYFRDFEIAIRLKAIGFTNKEISHAIESTSPLLIDREVHPRYTKHLIGLINAPHIKQEWKDIVAKSKKSWVMLSESTLNLSYKIRPKF